MERVKKLFQSIKDYFRCIYIIQFYTDTDRRNAKGLRIVRYKYLIQDAWKDKNANQGMTEKRDLAKRFYKWQAQRLRRKAGLSEEDCQIIKVA